MAHIHTAPGDPIAPNTTARMHSEDGERRFSAVPYLFSPRVDLAAFLGSAVAAMLLLVFGAWAGWLHRDTPEWTWITAVLLVDVAHVYATCFRVYFVPQEFARRRWLYVLVPALGYAVAWALYSESVSLFWRALAYVAVFHFVRQQYGWVALYRARGREQGRVGWWVDATAIYVSTLYPLLYWHAHLPRQFWWFVEHDFARVPMFLVHFMQPVYWLALVAYAARSLYRGLGQGQWNPFKDIVVVTTALCWHLGIITFNSDYAFTVTNVIIHGVPYLVLVYWFDRQRRAENEAHAANPARSRGSRSLWIFLGTVWVLAYAEELVWDRGVWHERAWLFGSPWELGAWETWLVPLLVVPQLTHYVLDGFIWKRRQNPELATLLRSTRG